MNCCRCGVEDGLSMKGPDLYCDSCWQNHKEDAIADAYGLPRDPDEHLKEVQDEISN